MAVVEINTVVFRKNWIERDALEAVLDCGITATVTSAKRGNGKIANFKNTPRFWPEPNDSTLALYDVNVPIWSDGKRHRIIQPRSGDGFLNRAGGGGADTQQGKKRDDSHIWNFYSNAGRFLSVIHDVGGSYIHPLTSNFFNPCQCVETHSLHDREKLDHVRRRCCLAGGGGVKIGEQAAFPDGA